MTFPCVLWRSSFLGDGGNGPAYPVGCLYASDCLFVWTSVHCG